MGRPIYQQRNLPNFIPLAAFAANVNTGTTAGNVAVNAVKILDVASTKRCVIKYMRLFGVITTVFGTGVVGSSIVISDTSSLTPIATLGTVAGASQAANTTFTNIDQYPFAPPGGYPLAALGNDLYAMPTAAAASGVVQVTGIILYDLLDA